MKTIRRTAANSKLLAFIKGTFNHHAYGRAYQLMNTSGVDACLDYVATLYHEGVRAERRAYLATLDK